MDEFAAVAEEIKQKLTVPEGIMREIAQQYKAGQLIVIFGAGNCGYRVYEYLHSFQIECVCFCDNRLKGTTDQKTGKKIVGTEDLAQDRGKYLILVSVADRPVYDEIYIQLQKEGFPAGQIYCMCSYIERLSLEYFLTNQEQYRKAYDSMEDDFSKAVFIGKLRYSYFADDISKVARPEDEEYFDENVVLSQEEVFVDCGGFDGDSALRFLEKTDRKYKKIIIFEPEESKEERIRANLKGVNYELYMQGVWSENTSLYFETKDNPSSCVSKVQGFGTEVKVVALDNVVYEEAPTFIKMDIEGSEKNALLGANRIIRDYRPKLAICVYHKPEDLFELPLLMKELNPSYKLYMRHYSRGMFQTICYAV